MAKKDASAVSASTSANNAVDAEKPAEEERAPKPKTPAKFAFHAIKIFDAIAICFALFVVLIARFFRPGFWSTLLYALIGLPAGVALSFLYFKRKREKRSRRLLVRPCTVIICLVCFRCQASLTYDIAHCLPAKLTPRDVQYNVEPGAKGVTELLQKIPTWLTLSEAEKCEV